MEDRLAKRKKLADMQNTETSLQNQEADQNRENNKNMVEHLVQEGQLTEKQKDELLRQYDQDVNNIQNVQDRGGWTVPNIIQYALHN